MADTLDEVAKMAEVSRATVSRVVNDHSNVSSETRKKVQRAIKESGYKPHAVARSLVTDKTGIVGLVIPESVSRLFSDPFFAPFIRSVTEECRKLGFELMLSLLAAPDEERGLYDRIVAGSYLDGLLLASAPVNDPLVEDLLEDNTPFVSVGRHPNERVNYVDVDNYGGARQATEYLLGLGHERIATVTGSLDQAAGIDRLKGYKDALKSSGVTVEKELIFKGDFTEGSGAEGVQRLLSQFPTAIFAASDKTAIGVLKELKKAGKKIPKDLAVVGFDDISASSAVDPPLTTISQPVERMARLSVRVLNRLIEGQLNKQNKPTRRVFKTELVVREST